MDNINKILDLIRDIDSDFKKERSDCLHDSCSECHGTGRRKNGQICIHMISCPCKKCTPFCMSV